MDNVKIVSEKDRIIADLVSRERYEALEEEILWLKRERYKRSFSPYVAFGESGIQDGCCLVFARNTREAKKAVYPVMKDLLWEEWTHMRVRIMQRRDYLFGNAEEGPVERMEPHVIDIPWGCNNCEMWGQRFDLDGICSVCGQKSGVGYPVIVRMIKWEEL